MEVVDLKYKAICILVMVFLLRPVPSMGEKGVETNRVIDQVFPMWKVCIDIETCSKKATRGQTAPEILKRYRQEHPHAKVLFCSNGGFFYYKDTSNPDYPDDISGIGQMIKDGKCATQCDSGFKRGLLVQQIGTTIGWQKHLDPKAVMAAMEGILLLDHGQRVKSRQGNGNVDWTTPNDQMAVGIDKRGFIHFLHYQKSLSHIQISLQKRGMVSAMSLDGGTSVYPGHKRLLQSIVVVVRKDSSEEYQALKKRLLWIDRFVAVNTKLSPKEETFSAVSPITVLSRPKGLADYPIRPEEIWHLNHLPELLP